MLAAIAYVKDDKAAFDRQVATVLEINPAYGERTLLVRDVAWIARVFWASQ